MISPAYATIDVDASHSNTGNIVATAPSGHIVTANASITFTADGKPASSTPLTLSFASPGHESIYRLICGRCKINVFGALRKRLKHVVAPL